MSLFFSAPEREAFLRFRQSSTLGMDLFWVLQNRVSKRAAHPGLTGSEKNSDWWFCTAEFLSDAAMVHALNPSPALAAWLRDATLSIIRRPESDWVGPPFRDHVTKPSRGHLETAHLTWGVAVVLDLAGDIFAPAEAEEIRTVLRDRGIPMCRRWLDANNHLANWRCVLGAGVAVAAAVLDDREEMRRAVHDYGMSLNIFQPDGSHAESLQYANYAAFSLMLAREALLRRDPDLIAELPATPWNKMPRWQAASLFYHKPLSGWGAEPRPRAANFNDSAAVFRPSGDLLLHLAARECESAPVMAGLARWLFDWLYANNFSQGPHDRATFGFYNDFGFLAVPLLPAAAKPIAPCDAGLTALEAFSCGDVLARDKWDGRTILAIRGGGDPLHGPGHLHGDLNSFILVHNRERLLIDPGHSCYRNLIHEMECASRTHNTCTFSFQEPGVLGLQEDGDERRVLEQSRHARVRFDRESGKVGPLADRGARRLIADRSAEVTVIGSDAAALYGKTIRQFSRFWILCGAHVLFVVDRIVASQPVRTAWHWLLNNRDGALEFKAPSFDRIVVRRGRAGMKLFHLGGAYLDTPCHAFVHDAYCPAPGGLGEGKPGSGLLLTWNESEPTIERTVVHAICVDDYGSVARWHLKDQEGLPVLESPGATARWKLDTAADATTIGITEEVSGKSWTLAHDGNSYHFTTITTQ
jgi:hypothetical protein